MEICVSIRKFDQLEVSYSNIWESSSNVKTLWELRMNFNLGVVLLLCVSVVDVAAQETISVETNIGTINGNVSTVNAFGKSGKLNTFLGIPFAEPPVGNLRFKKPVPKVRLSKPLNAYTHNNACLQDQTLPGTSYSEDCLYLNIYAPQRENGNVKLPVMVWVYGGGFHFGDSNMYSGEYLSIHGDVIVVTLNYRLNIFGFLSTGDDASPGNYGLWDQHMALQWVHDNIEAFGGDAEKVTIFGESAGATGVIYQGLYKGNTNLFQRIIAQSGSVMAWWASIDERRLTYARTVGGLFDCDMATTQALVSCLRDIPAQDLITKILYTPRGDDLGYYPFTPTVDNDFISFDPHTVFDSRDYRARDAVQFFANFDLLTGVNIIEGVTGLDPMFGVMEVMNFTVSRSEFKNNLIPALVKVKYGEEYPEALVTAIANEYTNWTDPDKMENVRNEFLRMHGDCVFNADMYKTIDTHSDQATAKSTYMYMLDTEPETYIGYSIPWITKAMHADELTYVFGFRMTYGLPYPTPTDWERNLSLQIMTMWTNFAKSGNPNLPETLGLDWSKYNKNEKHYLHITRDMTAESVRQRWNLGPSYFWMEVAPSIAEMELESCDSNNHGGVNSADSSTTCTMFSLLMLHILSLFATFFFQ